MKALMGDTVIDGDRNIGIVEGRDGTMLTVRYPAWGNSRARMNRSEVQHLAERIREAREDGRPLQVGPRSASRETRHWPTWLACSAIPPASCAATPSGR